MYDDIVLYTRFFKSALSFRLAAAAAAAAGATSELSYLAALHPAYRPVPYDHPLYGANTLRGKFLGWFF